MSETVLRGSLDYLVGVAVRAPSLHNSQPWRFRIRGHRLELLADHTRGLTVADPEGRELTIGCGAALLNLRLAVGHLGYDPLVEALPDPAEADLLARIALGHARPPDPDDEDLLIAVPRRHTHRGRFEAQPLDDGLIATLQDDVAREGARLHVLDDATRRRTAAAIVEEAEREQQTDPRYREELASWTPEPGTRRRTGVPATAYPRSSAAPARGFDLGRGWGLMAPDDADAAVVLVLTTGGDDVPDWLTAGQALERMLLRAASHWAFAAFLTQPTELPHLRTLLRDALRLDGAPQVVMRMGHAAVAATTPRMPVDRTVVGTSPGPAEPPRDDVPGRWTQERTA